MQNTIEEHLHAIEVAILGTACWDRYCTGYLLTSRLQNHIDLHKCDVLCEMCYPN